MARLLCHCCNKEAIVLARYRLATSWTIRALNPGGGEIFRARPYRDVALTIDIPLLAPSLCMVRAITLPPFCAFMACYRVAVALPLYYWLLLPCSFLLHELQNMF